MLFLVIATGAALIAFWSAAGATAISVGVAVCLALDELLP